jgi:hypothetical protein
MLLSPIIHIKEASFFLQLAFLTDFVLTVTAVPVVLCPRPSFVRNSKIAGISANGTTLAHFDGHQTDGFHNIITKMESRHTWLSTAIDILK